METPPGGLVDGLLGVLTAVIGFVVHGFRQDMKDQKTDITATKDRVATLETLVAGEYLKRGEFNSSIESLRKEMNANFARVFDDLKDKEDKT